MTLDQALSIFDEYQQKLWALSAASGIIYHDGNTVAPKKSAQARGRIIAALAEQSYGISTDKSFMEALEVIDCNKDKCDGAIVKSAYLYLKEARDMAKIPAEEYVEFSRHINESSAVWHEAKENSDFASFAPYLEKTVETLRRFASYTDPEKDVYDVCLDSYEKGLTTEKCEQFFGALKPVLKELISKVAAAKPVRTDFMKEHFPIDKQKALADYITELMGIDTDRFAIAETEHPYTTDASRYDVRIATHYYEDAFASALFSNIHENGHALYELGTGEEYAFTNLGGGVSMGIHESQSRFYENIIGRSYPFANLILPKLKELAPAQFRDVDGETLWKALCESKPSLIRTESDELTYTMHIIIRYELENLLMHGELTVDKLPEEWNRRYKEYLGVDVPDDKHGVLQDSHWSGGSIGYFPSYALGSAYGAQLLCKMKESVNVEQCIEKGDFAPINNWLEQNIWRHGRRYDPNELLTMACKQEFTPDYFIDYLTEKYTKIYNL